MKLSIVILAFNKFKFTKSCLNDLSYLPNDHEIIIIDNNSTDETKEQLESSEEITYIRNNENLGFAKGCNQGYRISKADTVLFLNNDIRVNDNKSNWTDNILQYTDKYLVSPTMGLLDKDLSFVKEENKTLTGNSYLSGWCLASSKNNFNKLDLGEGQIFNEKFNFYFEDTDLSFRARKLGIPMKVVEIPVSHFGKVSSKQLNVSALYSKAREVFIKQWKK